VIPRRHLDFAQHARLLAVGGARRFIRASQPPRNKQRAIKQELNRNARAIVATALESAKIYLGSARAIGLFPDGVEHPQSAEHVSCSIRRPIG